MKSKSPSFQWYPKQWLGDDKVMLMDWDARGMHFHLINISWEQAIPGTIPHDETTIRRWLKNPPISVWKRVWPQIKSAWKIWGKNDGFLYSRGMLREYKKQRSFSKKQKENAQKRWIPRRRKSDATAYAMAMPPHDFGNARAGNALQSSSAEAEERLQKEERAARPPGGAAALLRPRHGNGASAANAAPLAAPVRPVNAAVIDGDERPDYGHGDFLATGHMSSDMPRDAFEWECLERNLTDTERVQSKWREKYYHEKEAPAPVTPGGDDDVF